MSKKRKVTKKEKAIPIFKKYTFEIKIVFLFTLGVFLLVENLEIKKYIYLLLLKILFIMRDSVIHFRDLIISFIQQIEVSDIVGISIIIYVMYLILDRWREKIVDRYSILNNCPKCNGDLHRIRKPLNHKLISYIAFLQIKYYQCKLCDFKGIKILK